MFKFGVDTVIWTEEFSEKDLWIIPRAKELGFDTLDIDISNPLTFPTDLVKEKNNEVQLEIVTSTGLNEKSNLLSPDPEIRTNGISFLKEIVDINMTLGSKVIGGMNYAAWGYLTGKPRTEQEWEWSVSAMREVAQYAKERSNLIIAVECLNRFETHFLNVADDAVRYCRDVGTGNVKVHLDTFHMIREEESFSGAVKQCGKEYLGYVHVCENHRGIPGKGLVPWKEFFKALIEVGYTGSCSIESFDPGFEEINKMCAIWRKFADSGEELAIQGLKNLRTIAKEVENSSK